MNWAKQNRFSAHGPNRNRRLWTVPAGPGAWPRPPQLSVWVALARQLPDVRIDKVILVQERLADETYDVPACLNVALDLAVDELEEQPMFLAPDQN